MTQHSSSVWSFLQSNIAQLLNGLTVAPTLYYLSTRGVFELFGDPQSPKEVDLLEITRKFVPDEPTKNLGSLSGAMRTLALHGWMEMDGMDENTILRLTSTGYIAVKTVEKYRDTFARAVSSIQHTKHYHQYFRERSDKQNDALREYTGLISESRRNWNIDRSSEKLAQRVLTHICRHLDGLLVCPTMVALGMPVFEEEGDTIREVGGSIFELFDDKRSLDLEKLGESFHSDFIRAAFDLLSAQDLAHRGDRDAVVVLTEQGVSLAREIANYGVTVSYLKSYESLDEILFGNPDPLGIREDLHVYRLMNVWGSGGSTVIQTFRNDICEKLIKPIFDEQALERQPAGIADMGCGSGLPLKMMADYVIHQTKRGRNLKDYPLVVLGADYDKDARGRARETLSAFDSVDGIFAEVIHGDVSKPDLYDATIKGLGIELPDPVTRRRLVGAADFFHTQMFLAHDRELEIDTREAASRIIEERIGRVDQRTLAEALKKLIGNGFSMPEDEGVLRDLVIRQFTTSCSNRGVLVPAAVSAADLIQLMEKWSVYAPHGLCLLEPHVPRIGEMPEDVPENPNELMRIEVDPSPSVWGIHYISGQYIMPFLEHELAMVLAGLIPVERSTTGTSSISLGYWVNSETIFDSHDSDKSEAFNF